MSPFIDTPIDGVASDEPGLPGFPVSERQCKSCRCDDLHACEGPDGLPCYWVEDDLCSACLPAFQL